jgi:hypothetical protein
VVMKTSNLSISVIALCTLAACADNYKLTTSAAPVDSAATSSSASSTTPTPPVPPPVPPTPITCPAGLTLQGGVCVGSVNQGSNALAGQVCIDHNAFFQFQMIGNQIVLWVWGTNPANTVIGWNCPDTTGSGGSYLPPIQVWSTTFTGGYMPDISLSGSILGGGGCNPAPVNFSGYGAFEMPAECPAYGAGNVQYSFDITLSPTPYTGPVSGTP